MNNIIKSLQAFGLLAFSFGLMSCGGDSGGGSSPVLTEPNPAPNPITVVGDFAFTDDGLVTVAVLANDTDDDNQTLSLTDFDTTSAGGGSLSLDDNGTPADASDDKITYQALPLFAGLDTFNYRVSNEDGDVNVGQVAVFTILAAADGKQSEVNAGNPTSPATPVSVDVLKNDVVGASVDGTAYIALLDSFDATSTQGGTVTLDDGGTPADKSDDSLQYTPAANFSGADQFTYRLAIAEGAFATGTVNIDVGGCTDRQAEKQAAGEKYCVELTMESFDGTTIAMQLFVPAKKSDNLQGNTSLIEEQGHAPLLIHSHGYGSNKAEDLFPPGPTIDRQISLDAWENGYWVISYTQRGFGGTDPSAEVASGGRIGLMGPEKEGLDFVKLVDWAICHLRDGFDPLLEDVASPMTPEDGCNAMGLVTASQLSSDDADAIASLADDPAVGTIGYSYGGGFQYNAQSVDSRLDAILPLGTWHDLRFSLAPNDTPKIAWIALLTYFSLDGGNGQQQPDVIVNANSEAFGANTSDGAYSKSRQISVTNYNILAPNGAIAYCDGHLATYGDPSVYPATLPANTATTSMGGSEVVDRRPRADMFLIQGYGDTLFNFNEAWDNTRCFEQAGVEVHTIFQTSGHPLPGVGPAHYAGQDQSMYLDEVVHCGVDTNGDPIRYNTRELGQIWFDDKLRGQGSFAATFPYEVCITVENTDPAVVLDTADPYFNNGTSNSSTASVPTVANPGSNRNYKFSREGVVYEDANDMLVGGTEFTVPTTTINSGSGGPTVFIEVYEQLSGSRTIAGIPTAALNITRPALRKGTDEIVFAGIAVQRCHANPADTGPCEGTDWELLHFQVSPIRLFPSLATEPAEPPADTGAQYPKNDPRNAESALNHVYPIRWGDNLGADIAEGRLPGVSARLNEGDKVALAFYAEIGVYQSISTSGTTGQLTVDGKVSLPLQATSVRPKSDEPYFVPAP